MPKPKSVAFARIRAEVVRILALIPHGKFTTYGSIAVHMNISARHVAFVMRRLTPEESVRLPCHRVVSADARLSPAMDPTLSKKQRRRLESEGMTIDTKGFIQDCDTYFCNVGERRDIRWDAISDKSVPPFVVRF